MKNEKRIIEYALNFLLANYSDEEEILNMPIEEIEKIAKKYELKD